jgi:uncharacterized protein
LKRSNPYCIDAPEADYLFIQHSQLTQAGKGLHTAIHIFPDEIISVFKGELLSRLEAKHRAEKGNDKYFISLVNGSTLDSMHVNCFAKYANDAVGFKNSKFKNNAKIAYNEKKQVCLIAICNIKSGAEIFCSYGKSYWKKHA